MNGQGALAVGVSARFAHHGETVTFRTVPLVVQINRAPEDRQPSRGGPDFQGRDMSVIEVQLSALPVKPKSGEYFTDSFGYKHRIQTFKGPINGTWSCHCEVFS